ncbi:MAG TPA: FtsX-like permease family protein, partial [Candidatus Acidoferrum sp.]|nr:FtsX-like permease family protein [Candidatus Acidoferrum sp.]
LSVARSVERQREVGIRKAAGAGFANLVLQFLGEALLLTAIALVLALALTELALPGFATLMHTQLQLVVTDGRTFAVLLSLGLVVAGLGGFYPALVQARFEPERLLKPAGGRSGGAALRNLLVACQFAIAIGLIVAVLVLYLQLDYLRGRDPGFQPERVVSVAMFDPVAKGKANALRDGIAALPGVGQVSFASRQANSPLGAMMTGTYRHDAAAATDVNVNIYEVDYDFADIYGMRLLAGRFFQRALDPIVAPPPPGSPLPATRSPDRLVVNATAVKALGFDSPQQAVDAIIQSTYTGPDKVAHFAPRQIIGVVADSQFASLRAVPGGEIFSLGTDNPWFITAKVDAAALTTIRSDLERLWSRTVGFGRPYVGFAADNVRNEFEREANEGRLLVAFSALAVVVACMGLYGLVAFETRRRTKEIGIRKVLGGDIRIILLLFVRQFAQPVCWANLLAWPVAVWAMLQWLQRFPYQIERWWLPLLCVVAALLVLAVTALTVSLTAIKSAGVKPVLALRYE